jgi:Ca2+-binding RTX toxin-like protein
MSVAPQILEALDAVSPKTGEVQYGEYTNDTAPVIRVTLGDQAVAGEILSLSDNGAGIGAGVTITSAMLAQGYADVPVSGLGEGWNLLTATVKTAAGATALTSMQFALGVATATPVAPVIQGAVDGSGQTLADGAHTAAGALTFTVFEQGLPAPPTSPPGHAPYGGPPLLDGHIQLYEGDQLVGDAMIGFGGQVTLTSGTLSPGEHTLTAEAIDRAGNVSAASAPFHIFVDAAPAAGGVAATDTTSAGSMLQASANATDLEGGAGADTLIGGAMADVLHGGAGADSIYGGTQYNNVNGNAGDDIIVGRSLIGDWLLGGQGNDSVDASQSSGHNILNGNLGADTLIAGSGADTLHGGQGDDLLTAGPGGDFLAGDLGSNTLIAGAGADTIHAGAGTDVVQGFSQAHGDVVLVDPGVQWTATQSGADTVITFTNHGQMTLSGVNLASLSSGWIVQT